MNNILKNYQQAKNRLILNVLGKKLSKHQFISNIWYQYLAKSFKDSEWTFTNYGLKVDEYSKSLVLETRDEKNRLSIQLYYHLLKNLDLSGKDVLELGSGRGGGADFIVRYFYPQRVVGLDKSLASVKISQNLHQEKKLEFIKGRAESIPFDSNSFDVLISVESSHCYKNYEKFMSEAWRVLKPKGYLLIADFRPADLTEKWKADIKKSSFKILEYQDITNKVFASLKEGNQGKIAMIKRIIPEKFQEELCQFAAIEGSDNFEAFKTRKYIYYSWILQKN